MLLYRTRSIGVKIAREQSIEVSRELLEIGNLLDNQQNNKPLLETLLTKHIMASIISQNFPEAIRIMIYANLNPHRLIEFPFIKPIFSFLSSYVVKYF
jgi:hypothetical protein